MYISARERKIIELLLNNSKGISIQEIAEQIQVSSRTIQREIKGIERILTGHSLVLKKLTGKGIVIEGHQDLIDELWMTLSSSGREFSPSERREVILCELLKGSDPIKLTSLANDLNVTVATISNDLTTAEKWLKKFDLKSIRKKGFGITLQGSEKQKRKALGALITEKLNEYEFLEAISTGGNGFSNQLLEFIKLEKVSIVGKVIREVERQLAYTLVDNSYMSLTIHLSLALERMMQGELIIMDATILAELKKSKEYFIATQIAKDLEDIFQITIVEAEIGYITMHLQGARLRHKKKDWIEKADLTIVAGTKKLIQYVSQQLNINFQHDKQLFEGLITHIEPAIYRIEKKLEVENLLVDQIKSDYPLLFGTIQKGLEISFPFIEFPDYESTYLVMHFASSHEVYELRREVSVLAICASGIGSSKLLASRIKKEVKEITSIDISAVYHLKDLNVDQYDLILSTIEMPGFSRKYLQVNPLLTSEDIERIHNELKSNYKTLQKNEERLAIGKLPLQPKKLKSPNHLKEKLQNINIYSETVWQIINTFETFSLSSDLNHTSFIKEVCDILLGKELILYSEPVTQKLYQREKLGGLGIPGTELALYHCRSESVPKPLFVTAKLPDSILLNSMKGSDQLVSRILILLAPIELHDTELDVLSLISSTIIDNDETIQIFTSGSDQEIIQTLMSEFEEALKQIINKNQGE